MKTFLLTLIMMSSVLCVSAEGKKKKKNKTEIDTTKITWLTIEQAEAEMKKNPKKVYVDVYTDWCGWCKVMDKKTFTNKELIKYMNTNFYAVKLNAEQKDSITFMGNKYGFVPAYRANMFAIKLLSGKMSYPSSVLLEEHFKNQQVVPGYLDVGVVETFLKYFAENHYKSTPFPEFQKEFKPTWVN